MLCLIILVVLYSEYTVKSVFAFQSHDFFTNSTSFREIDLKSEWRLHCDHTANTFIPFKHHYQCIATIHPSFLLSLPEGIHLQVVPGNWVDFSFLTNLQIRISFQIFKASVKEQIAMVQISASSLVRIFLSVVSLSLGTMAVLLLKPNSKRSRPILDENGKILEGSISEKRHVLINGVQQGMFIVGRSMDNPVLLFVHGGTAMPEYFLDQKYRSALEQYFTVCWWERRGAGLSYNANTSPKTITLEQWISDTIQITNYLRKRFRKDKIYLMAHSGGSVIAIQAAAQAPELYAAYIGVGQISYQLQSEVLSYEYLLQKYRELGNQRMARQLEAAPVTMTTVPLPAPYMRVRDEAMHSLGVGTTRDMRSVMTGVFLESWLCQDYTISEKLALWRGKFCLDRIMWDKMIVLDLTKIVQEVDLPVYFFHGKYDYTVSYPMAKAFLSGLRAPVKGFYTFGESAHSPMFEEPGKMKQIMQEDILTGVSRLSDDM